MVDNGIINSENFYKQKRPLVFNPDKGGIAMHKGNEKKKWGKPKLIILTRGKPEERVLAVCKIDWPTHPVGPDGGVGSCAGASCTSCYERTIS